MAWKGDGSGRKDSPKGGISGGMAGGGRQGNAGGGFSAGMTGATMRRTPVQSPSYDASLSNLAKMAGTMLPGAGLIQGAMGLATGQFGPSYSGYQGKTATPGSYDPKGGPQPMAQGGGVGLQVKGPQFIRQSDFGGYPAGYPVDRIRQALGLAAPPAPAAPQQAQGLMFKPQMYQPQQISIPGGSSYTQQFDPWKYFA